MGNDLNLAGEPAKHQFQEIFPTSWQDLPVVGPIFVGQSRAAYLRIGATAALGLPYVREER